LEDANPFPESFKKRIGSNVPGQNKIIEGEKLGVQKIINRARKDIHKLAEHTLELLK